MLKLTRTVFTQQEGQGLAEYAFILALVALAVVAGFKTLGTALSEKSMKLRLALNEPTHHRSPTYEIK